ncbi:mucolipin-2 [Cricetulus griseus]|nr:mucolipin-2 [Cricetulus griseus]
MSCQLQVELCSLVHERRRAIVWKLLVSGRKAQGQGDRWGLLLWAHQGSPDCGCRRSAVASLDSEVREVCLREDLKFYFMNPCEKYRARRQIPWKLGLQILKIAMVTTQLVRFGLGNQLVVAFKEDNTLAFKHLFLKGFSGVDEDDYSCSVYTQEDTYESIFFAIKQASVLNGLFLKATLLCGCAVLANQQILSHYHHLKNISLATIDYGENGDNTTGLRFCKQHYKTGTMLSSNETLNIDTDIESDCTHLDLQALDKEPKGWTQAPFFRLDFYRLVRVEISFALKGIDLQAIHSREVPDCYSFQNTASVFVAQQPLSVLFPMAFVEEDEHLSITFDNTAHSGKVKVYFNSEANIEECKAMNISGSIQRGTHYVLVFDAFVIMVCLASLILCTRSIVLALRLRKRFLNFFLEKYKRHVCDADQWEFINGWYVLVTISDLMTIIGSVLKMEIKAKNLTNYDLCSILLGTSTLFVWVGVIRYLGYFQTYNVLILTMQASLPKVLRFCACAGMIYLGYTFCGWIVLGPYHEKFENLNIVSECLFSLVNGDDMFATFAQIQQKSTLVWLFSRLYLYSFISLFIYMVLSLFIALITDSYHTIKKYQQNGFPETDLQKFLKEHSSKEGYQKEPPALLSCVCCLRRSVLCL